MAIATKMKYKPMNFIKYFALGVSVMILITYAFGWVDLVNNKMLTGNMLIDLKKSFEDFWGALYYFRYIILVGSIILAFIFYGVKIGIEKLRG